MIVSFSPLPPNNNLNASGVSCANGANNSSFSSPSSSLPESGLGNLVVNSAGAQLLGFSPSALRAKLRRFQAGSQAKSCGTRLNLPAVLAHVPSGASGDLVYAVCGGESTCKSPRCPKCRLGLLSGRSTEIQFCIDRYLAESPFHRVSLLTLTAPHYISWSLARFLGSTKSRLGIRGAVARLKERKNWSKTVDHFVSGLEITYGKNGWHAHFHILVFHSLSLDSGDWYQNWVDCCLESGLGRPSQKHGLTLQSGTNAARYISKWSLASEAIGGDHKQAIGDNRSIAQIEQAAAAGDTFSQRKLLVYNKTTLRARWHNFSRSLSSWRKEYNSGRPAPLPLLVFDAPSSAEILQDSSLRALIAEVCSAAGADDLEGLPSAFGLAGEVPENPDLVWMSDPTRRAWSEYNRCLVAGLEQEASEHWLSYEFYLGKSIESSCKKISRGKKSKSLDPFCQSAIDKAWRILESK